MRGVKGFRGICNGILCYLFLGACSLGLWAQGTGGRGSISGIVTDPTGALVGGVSVTALNTGTGLSTVVTTNGSGGYVLPLLPVGTYNLTFQKEGFKTETRAGMTLVADVAASSNVVLTVGSATEKVTVNASAATLETESAALTTTVNETAIKELPLNGRNPASLVLLSPGTTDMLKNNVGNNQAYTTHPDQQGASANGGRQGSTYYLLDGSNNMDPYVLLAAPFPNADATHEFSVIGNNFDAQYGFSPGAVVSIVTNSGTNQWHGNLFEFLRNDAFNAKEFYSQQKDGLKRNQFGGSLGGPIVKDKLFIFGNYQETLGAITSNTGQTSTPTAAMRTGDFSAVCVSGFDATTGICNDRDGGGNVIDQVWQDPAHTIPFTDNMVAAGQLNQGVLNLLNKFVPAGTGAVGPSGGLLFVNGLKYSKDDYQYTIRADYNPSEKHRFTGHVFRDQYRQPFITGNGNLTASDRSSDVDYGNYEGTYTWTVNPTIVNQAAFSFGREYATSLSGQVDSSGHPICLSQFFPNMADPPGGGCAIESFPYINGQTASWYHRYIWNLTDSVTISKGKHLIVAGVDVQRMDMADPSGWLSEPIVNFDGAYTGLPASDILLGHVQSFEQGAGSNSLYTGTQLGIYAQDRIRLTPTFTVSAGLRFEPFIPPVPYHGRAEYYRPGQQSTRFPNAPLGMVFPGDQGIPAGGTTEQNYFSPRLGIAWAPKFLPHTSIRAAGGLFTAPIDYSHYTHAGDNFPWSPTYSFDRTQVGGDINLNNVWANYPATGGQNPFPPFSGGGPGLPVYQPPSNVAFPTPGLLFGYSAQAGFNLGQTASWNLSIEHQFGSNWLIRAAYVASESWHQDLVIEQNPGQFICAPVGPNCTQAQFNQNGLPPNANFGNIDQNNSVGTANYQSGQFTLEKTFSMGLQFSANYTYSKTIDEASIGTIAFAPGGGQGLFDPFNVRANRGNSDLDFPQVLSVNWVYKTPALRSMNPGLRGVFGSWELSGIWHAQSGLPTTVYGGNGDNNSFSQIGLDHADLTGDAVKVNLLHHTGWTNNYIPYFNGGAYTASALGASGVAFQANPLGTFGTSGRNVLFGPGVNSFDIGIDKNVPFREHYNVQFRWEMFNAFNRTTFGAPCADITGCGIYNGVIYNTNGNYPPRVMQAAMKFTF